MPEIPLAPQVLFILAMTAVAVVSLVGYFRHAGRSAELAAGVERDELALKLEMVKAGMSADEIVRVVGAGARPADVSEPAGV